MLVLVYIFFRPRKKKFHQLFQNEIFTYEVVYKSLVCEQEMAFQLEYNGHSHALQLKLNSVFYTCVSSLTEDMLFALILRNACFKSTITHNVTD